MLYYKYFLLKYKIKYYDYNELHQMNYNNCNLYKCYSHMI